LKQFAVYTPTSANKAKRDVHDHAHAHNHAHAHAHIKEKRADIWVTATIDGKVVSWINNWNPAGAASSTAPAATSTKPAAVATTTLATSYITSVAPAQSTSTIPTSSAVAASSVAPIVKSNVAVGSGGWSQVSYYNSEASSSSGCTFMGNHGGSGSGVWDSSFGMSLAYLSSDASTGAASAQVLQDMTVPSGTEFSIFSGTPCSGNSCGYYRPGSVAYRKYCFLFLTNSIR